jgi:hypothetical protein
MAHAAGRDLGQPTLSDVTGRLIKEVRKDEEFLFDLSVDTLNVIGQVEELKLVKLSRVDVARDVTEAEVLPKRIPSGS